MCCGWCLPVAAATGRDLVLFTVGVRSVSAEAFVVATDDPDLVARARSELALPVAERRLFPSGRVIAGHGGFNRGWSWHLDPDGWDLVETATEVCDARPSYVEDHLASWLAEVGRYCPWQGYLKAEGVVGPVADPARFQIELIPAVVGVSEPVAMTSARDGSGRLFVAEKGGRVRIVRDDALVASPFLDISDRVLSSGSEQGLLGVAFHPDYGDTGWVFVNYTDLAGDTVVSRFDVSTSDPDRADPGSEQILLQIEQPFSNHNGGHLAFGADGMLYVGTGDGGSGGDPLGSGQNPQSLLGKMLRFGIDGSGGLVIPDDNPFVGDASTRDEIWALGLRNPWRFSFDRVTGDLYIGDVGQNQYEEIDVEGRFSVGGVNWGWNRMEGFHCYDGASCDSTGLQMPAVEYDHGEGCSVTGGVVYQGSRFPFLNGTYLFADYCSGRIWALEAGGRHGWAVATVGSAGAAISVIGEDEDGEIWVADLAGDRLLRLQATENSPPPRRGGGRVAP